MEILIQLSVTTAYIYFHIFNYLKDIVMNGMCESFFYLIDNDNSIITTLFENNKNLLHIIKTNGKYDKIIDKIMGLLIKNKYQEKTNISDDQFLEMCANYNLNNNENPARTK